MKHYTAILLAALLVASAGCSTLGASDPNPAPTTQPTTTAAPTPPGVTESGVTDALALAEAHERVVDASAVTARSRHVERHANGSLHARTNWTATATAGQSQYHLRVDTAGPGYGVLGAETARAAFWSNGTAALGRVVADGSTAYQRLPADGSGLDRYGVALADDERTYALLAAASNATVEPATVDGEPAYRVAATEFADPTALPGVEPGGTVSNATVTLLVRPSGLVVERRVTYRLADGVVVNDSLTYADVNATTVERPAWVDDALSETDG